MNMPEAVGSCLRKYARFEGRASRSEYWWFVLFTTIVALICGVIDHASGVRVLGTVANVILFLPGLALAVRRLHDTDHSGWWYLGMPLVLPIYWIFRKGDDHWNRFGADPLNPEAMAPTRREPTVQFGSVKEPTTTAQRLVELGIMRLVTHGKGVSVPLSGSNDEVTFGTGIHEGTERGYALFTRDADETTLQLDFDLPAPESPNHAQTVSRLARELVLQAERRLPRMTLSKAEDVWARLERARQQPQPVGMQRRAQVT